MQFFAGVISDNSRCVMVGHADPTAKMTWLTNGPEPADMCDWGEDASNDAAYRTAYLILSKLMNDPDSRLCLSYRDAVVKKAMITGQPWLMPVAQVQQWITETAAVQ